MRPIEQRRIIPSSVSARDRVLTRVILWIILGIGVLLSAALAGEAVTRANAEAQVAAEQAHLAALQRTIAQTRHAIATAQSDDEIERAARRWGYIRPGDQPVIIVTAGPTH